MFIHTKRGRQRSAGVMEKYYYLGPRNMSTKYPEFADTLYKNSLKLVLLKLC